VAGLENRAGATPTAPHLSRVLRAHCTAGTRTRCSPTLAAPRQRAVAVQTAPHALKA
jgi:hypothetical protein